MDVNFGDIHCPNCGRLVEENRQAHVPVIEHECSECGCIFEVRMTGRDFEYRTLREGEERSRSIDPDESEDNFIDDIAGIVTAAETVESLSELASDFSGGDSSASSDDFSGGGGDFGGGGSGGDY